MSSIENFSPEYSLILKVHGDDVEILNYDPSRGLILGREERRYLSNRPENVIFHFFHTSGIYRCLRSGDLVICLSVTDIVEEREREHRSRVEIQERYDNLLRMNDLVIHDIKNYVFVLDGITTLMEEGDFGEDLVRDLRRAVENIKELISRTSILLKTKSSLRITEVNIGEMVEQVFRELSVPMRDRRIHAAKRCEVDVIKTDPLIKEVIFNLVSNAVEHAPDGGVVEVECRASGRRFTMAVRDNGPGIPDEMKSIIFERLKSAASSRGMGLGLAVCKHIVELLGGRIWVEDNEPRGAVFVVEIPVGK